jgi:LysR family transcriptional regulator (chromosome initiation inhibitor)
VTTLKQALRGCKVVPLGAMRYVAVASADFFATRSARTPTSCADAPAPKASRPAPPEALNAHNFRDFPFVAFNRKDDMQAEFIAQAFGLKRVTLNQLFVPSSEGQVRAVLAGWGVSVVPELLVQGLIDQGRLVNAAPGHHLDIQLFWHCWNLESEVLDVLTAALKQAAAASLASPVASTSRTTMALRAETRATGSALA